MRFHTNSIRTLANSATNMPTGKTVKSYNVFNDALFFTNNSGAFLHRANVTYGVFHAIVIHGPIDEILRSAY
jgi:hypothetical protein